MVQTQTCTEDKPFKIFQDFNIQMDNITEHRRPDMINMGITSKKAQIFDLTFLQTTGLKFSNRGKSKILKI